MMLGWSCEASLSMIGSSGRAKEASSIKERAMKRLKSSTRQTATTHCDGASRHPTTHGAGAGKNGRPRSANRMHDRDERERMLQTGNNRKLFQHLGRSGYESSQRTPFRRSVLP